jgi:hypothetical protein
MLLPPPVKRAQFYSRNPHSRYVEWLLDKVNLTDYEEDWHKSLLIQPIRSSVDEMVEAHLSLLPPEVQEKVTEEIVEVIDEVEEEIDAQVEEIEEEAPSWVEAAFDVLKDKVEDVVEDIKEEVEDVVEAIFDKEEEESHDTEVDIEEVVEESIQEEVAEEVEVAEEATSVDNPFGGEIDYNSYTVRELQALCKDRGITIRGTKSEVVLRLRHHDAGIVDQPTKGKTDVPSEEATEVEPDTPSQEAVTEDVTQHDDSRQEPPDNEEE